MKDFLKSGLKKMESIQQSGFTIYDQIEVGSPIYWLTSLELQAVLNHKLVGLSLFGLPLRTRSKTVKSEICKALYYPVPSAFKKTQPRFPGQRFDVYTQKSNNLQVWNEDLDLTRRYVLIGINNEDVVFRVKVVTGSDLAPLDTTGTLTQKYQARLKNLEGKYELVKDIDTAQVTSLCGANISNESPVDDPIKGNLLPIKVIYEKLKSLVGSKIVNPGADQERNRGAALHRVVCLTLGYSNYEDNGQFPDVRNQLLEVKFQTSPTIDLGLVSPESEAPLDMEKVNDISIRHCDVRYALFYGETEVDQVTITNLIVTNGENFYGRFPKFEGKGLNKKIQIRLPKNYFEV